MIVLMHAAAGEADRWMCGSVAHPSKLTVKVMCVCLQICLHKVPQFDALSSITKRHYRRTCARQHMMPHRLSHSTWLHVLWRKRDNVSTMHICSLPSIGFHPWSQSESSSLVVEDALCGDGL